MLSALMASTRAQEPPPNPTTVPTHEERIDAARARLDLAKTHATEEMIRTFERAISKIDPKNEKLSALRAQLQGELAEFRSSGTMPKSECMKATARSFEASWSTARKAYRREVLAIADELRKAKMVDEAQRVQTDLAGFCPEMIDPKDFAVRMEPFAQKVHGKITKRQTQLHGIRDELSALVRECAHHQITAEALRIRIKALIAAIEASWPLQKPGPENRVAGDALREALGQLRVCLDPGNR